MSYTIWSETTPGTPSFVSTVLPTDTCTLKNALERERRTGQMWLMLSRPYALPTGREAGWHEWSNEKYGDVNKTAPLQPWGRLTDVSATTLQSKRSQSMPNTTFQEYKYFKQEFQHSVVYGLHYLQDALTQLGLHTRKQKADHSGRSSIPNMRSFISRIRKTSAPSQTPFTRTGAKEWFPWAWCCPLTRCRWLPLSVYLGFTNLPRETWFPYLSGEINGTRVACLQAHGTNPGAAP
jgi:hypothetical protein